MAEIKLADRMDTLPPYAFTAIAKRVTEVEAQGNDVIRLDMGSPDMPPPQVVLDALMASAQDGSHHGYTGYWGIRALRQAFSDYYARRFEVGLDPDREVLPLIGSKEGIVNIGLALLNPGDVVLVSDLAYPAYAGGAYLAGAEPYEYHLDPGAGYVPDLASIPASVLKRARLMWINYPHNPTGAVLSRQDMAGIVEFCERHDIMLCSDNPYADISFDGSHPPSLLEIPGAIERAVEFNSLSKTYNMAGWRIGACVGNSAMVDALLRVKSNVDSGMFRVVQDAACVALNEVTPDWIAARNAIYQRRRDIVLEAAPRIGLKPSRPQAGLYVWAGVDSGDDEQYVRMALDEVHVSVTPGRIYGSGGRGYVRISLVTSEERIQTATQRLMALWK